MNFFILLFVTWTWQVCSSKPTRTNDSNSTLNVQSGSYPYHVLITLKYSEKFFICEGALIAENFVLTAAGCVDKYKRIQKSLQVIAGAKTVGDVDSGENVQKRSVNKIYLPSKWFSSNKQFADIAILKVSKSFDLNDHVNLGSLSENVMENGAYAVVGYGWKEELGLHKELVTILPKEKCEINLGISIDSSIFCTEWKKRSDLSDYGAYAGAPLFDQNGSSDEIYGIFTAKVLGTFTHLSPFKNWIEKITGVKTTAVKVNNEDHHHEDNNSFVNNAGGATTPSTTANPTSTTAETTKPVTCTESDSSETEENTDSNESYDDWSDEKTTTISTTIEDSDESTSDSDESETEITTIIPSTTASSSEEETTEESYEEEDEQTTTAQTTIASDEDSTESSESSESDESEKTTMSPSTTTVDDYDETSESSESSEELEDSEENSSTITTSDGSTASSTSTTSLTEGTSTSSSTDVAASTPSPTSTSQSQPTSYSTLSPTNAAESTSSPTSTSESPPTSYSTQSPITQTSTIKQTETTTDYYDDTDYTDYDDDDDPTEKAPQENVSRNSADTRNRSLSLLPSLMPKVGIFDVIKRLKNLLMA